MIFSGVLCSPSSASADWATRACGARRKIRTCTVTTGTCPWGDDTNNLQLALLRDTTISRLSSFTLTRLPREFRHRRGLQSISMAYTGQVKRDYQLAWLKRRRDSWISENGPCAHCGSSEDLEVDHIDKATKSLQPTSVWSLTATKREIELAKCQVLCRTCHKIKSDDEQRYAPPHGTRGRYMRYGCRCVDCRNAASVYRQRQRQRQR